MKTGRFPLVPVEEQTMMRFRALAALAALLVFDAALPAGVVYTLNNRRFFPAADGTVSDATSGTLTAATADSHATDYTDPLSGNEFHALSGITGTLFQLNAHNSVTIDQATTSSCCGILSLVSSEVTETGVMITGGSGTGYLIPTFHVHGTFDDNNASLVMNVAVCAGNASCILSGAGSIAAPGFQNVDTFFTPGISPSTSFTFGTPFNFFFFLEPGIEYQTAQANPGGASTADFKMELAGVQVMNSDGHPINGWSINSEFFALAAPEPAPIPLCGVALAAVCVARRKRHSIDG